MANSDVHNQWFLTFCESCMLPHKSLLICQDIIDSHSKGMSDAMIGCHLKLIKERDRKWEEYKDK